MNRPFPAVNRRQPPFPAIGPRFPATGRFRPEERPEPVRSPSENRCGAGEAAAGDRRCGRPVRETWFEPMRPPPPGADTIEVPVGRRPPTRADQLAEKMGAPE
ncbi:hypothetical protein GCM10010519_14590 [Streptomyces lactacystinicus]